MKTCFIAVNVIATINKIHFETYIKSTSALIRMIGTTLRKYYFNAFPYIFWYITVLWSTTIELYHLEIYQELKLFDIHQTLFLFEYFL